MKIDRDDVAKLLRRLPRSRASTLCTALGEINRSTLTRLIATMGNEVLQRGGSRRTRYAMRRTVRGGDDALSLYRVDSEGQGEHLGMLDPIYPDGAAMRWARPFDWPLDSDMLDGWFDSLPYPLLDNRPQGFLGRHFAHRVAPLLALPDDLNAWQDDHILTAISTFGDDLSGNLILGDRAYARHLERRRAPSHRVLRDTDLPHRYPEMAAAALNEGDAGASAGGEFPKFTAWREGAGPESVQAVIVKFSGADTSPAVQRWSDLLVCEHLALETMRALHDVAAAASTIHRHAGRTFLEVSRFDRVGLHGRIGLCSLGALNHALLGDGSTAWPDVARRLVSHGWLDGASQDAIARIWWFGKLIANTDMHDGNLSFHPASDGTSTLTLAPAYDMLPMRYAALRGGEVPALPPFAPALPLPTQRQAWQAAAIAAHQFWLRAGSDARISDAFRHICRTNADAVSRAMDMPH